MVHCKPTLKTGVFIRVTEPDADQAVVNRSVDRPIYQSAIYRKMSEVCKCRMRIDRCVTIGRKAIYHACSPWIAAKQPVDIGLLQFRKLPVARKPLVPQA